MAWTTALKARVPALALVPVSVAPLDSWRVWACSQSPGVGPVVAAGWLVATAAGAATGALTGGIIGALTQAGVSEEDAHVYAEGVRRGGTLVTARVPDGDASRLESILDRSSLRTNDLRSSYSKSGWKPFDEKAKPYSPDEVRQYRGYLAVTNAFVDTVVRSPGAMRTGAPRSVKGQGPSLGAILHPRAALH